MRFAAVATALLTQGGFLFTGVDSLKNTDGAQERTSNNNVVSLGLAGREQKRLRHSPALLQEAATLLSNHRLQNLHGGTGVYREPQAEGSACDPDVGVLSCGLGMYCASDSDSESSSLGGHCAVLLEEQQEAGERRHLGTARCYDYDAGTFDCPDDCTDDNLHCTQDASHLVSDECVTAFYSLHSSPSYLIKRCLEMSAPSFFDTLKVCTEIATVGNYACSVEVDGVSCGDCTIWGDHLNYDFSTDCSSTTLGARFGEDCLHPMDFARSTGCEGIDPNDYGDGCVSSTVSTSAPTTKSGKTPTIVSTKAPTTVATKATKKATKAFTKPKSAKVG